MPQHKTSARTGRSAPLGRGELVIDRQRILDLISHQNDRKGFTAIADKVEGA
jgi:hypothetical protein